MRLGCNLACQMCYALNAQLALRAAITASDLEWISAQAATRLNLRPLIPMALCNAITNVRSPPTPISIMYANLVAEYVIMLYPSSKLIHYYNPPFPLLLSLPISSIIQFLQKNPIKVIFNNHKFILTPKLINLIPNPSPL